MPLVCIDRGWKKVYSYIQGGITLSHRLYQGGRSTCIHFAQNLCASILLRVWQLHHRGLRDIWQHVLARKEYLDQSSIFHYVHVTMILT
jgi:hypothetical protein